MGQTQIIKVFNFVAFVVKIEKSVEYAVRLHNAVCVFFGNGKRPFDECKAQKKHCADKQKIGKIIVKSALYNGGEH